MSERYWISGVQLGVLIEVKSKDKREVLIKQIIKTQFIGNKQDLDKLLKFKEVVRK